MHWGRFPVFFCFFYFYFFSCKMKSRLSHTTLTRKAIEIFFVYLLSGGDEKRKINFRCDFMRFWRSLQQYQIPYELVSLSCLLGKKNRVNGSDKEHTRKLLQTKAVFAGKVKDTLLFFEVPLIFLGFSLPKGNCEAVLSCRQKRLIVTFKPFCNTQAIIIKLGINLVSKFHLHITATHLA